MKIFNSKDKWYLKKEPDDATRYTKDFYLYFGERFEFNKSEYNSKIPDGITTFNKIDFVAFNEDDFICKINNVLINPLNIENDKKYKLIIEINKGFWKDHLFTYWEELNTQYYEYPKNVKINIYKYYIETPKIRISDIDNVDIGNIQYIEDIYLKVALIKLKDNKIIHNKIWKFKGIKKVGKNYEINN